VVVRQSRGRPACAAIVRPFSSGAGLEAELHSLGCQVLAVVPARPLPVHHFESFDARRYDRVFTENGDLAALARQLRFAGVTGVVPGCEDGVWLADELCGRLGLPGNPRDSTASRISKSAQAATLAAAGVPVPQTVAARTLSAAFAIVDVFGGYPVVAKPDASAGNDGVRIVRNSWVLTDAWEQAANRINALGNFNYGLVIQRHLAGRALAAVLPACPGGPGRPTWQYTVNTVSAARPGAAPVHYVTDAWLDRRRELASGHSVYDVQVLLAGDDPVTELIGRYAVTVLDALKIRGGAAHVEIMLVPAARPARFSICDGRGVRLTPVLIEAGARLGGMISPSAMRAALGASQVTILAEALAAPGRFARRVARGPYRKVASAAQLDLIAPHAATLDGGVLDKILSLPTVIAATQGLQPGARVERTMDLLQSPGKLDLVGDADQVAADCAAVREAERHLYRALPG
jgi:Carbamoyl-phosphate synthase L chain, ATP binding domain